MENLISDCPVAFYLSGTKKHKILLFFSTLLMQGWHTATIYLFLDRAFTKVIMIQLRNKTLLIL